MQARTLATAAASTLAPWRSNTQPLVSALDDAPQTAAARRQGPNPSWSDAALRGGAVFALCTTLLGSVRPARLTRSGGSRPPSFA